ncbi:MAG: c-type cytochrome biogenesis protein CcsB [Elusimicrobia bacterium]|nr:c-type cytochrome biogenesis protein CcsB [Candidatus Obscuribacterium magneticum]
MENVFFIVAFVGYVIGTVLYLSFLFSRGPSLPRVAKGFLTVAVISHIISLLVRTYLARLMPEHSWYVPWSNWFESFSFFSLVITVLFLILQVYRSLPILGTFTSPLALTSLVVAVSSPSGRGIPDMPPALQSFGMMLHVPVIFLAYAAFANAFGVGLAFLIGENQLKSKRTDSICYQLPSLEELDNLIYKIIWLAFPLLTLGILLGAAWAHLVWGRYWGWDPKETWSLITWVVYLIYLFLRLVLGWRGRKTTYFSLVGFGVIIFTYVGVNHLSHLHRFLSAVGR